MNLTDRVRSLFGRGAPPTAPPTSRASGPAGGRLRVRNAAYEAGALVPRTRGWGAENPTANWATASASTIRARCRDATRNNAWARALVETFTDDVVGWGIGLLPRGTDTRTREAITELWREWEELAGADGQNLAAVQVAAVRQVIVDGECFVRLRTRRPSDGLPVPLQLEVLPPEICPAEYSFGAREGHIVKDGIEFDAIGRRTAYFLRDAVPGEDDGLRNSGTVRRVPAERVLHVFEPQRPGQRRGVPMLAAALVRLHELDKFEDAALLRQQMANMFGAFIRRPPQIDDELTDPLTGLKADPYSNQRTVALEPATIQELYPGEDIEFSDPPEASAAHAEFVKSHLRAAGAAVGVPYEVFSGDWGSTNDRLARVVLNQYRRRVLRFIWTVVVPQFMQPVYHAWLFRAMPSLTGVSTVDAMRATWSLHAWPYVHPVQDVASTQQAIRAGLTSRAAAVGETGESVEQIDAEQAEDNARADKLGLRYDSDARQAKPARRTR